MLKFSKSILVIALALCATSAMATNFRGADQIYVPAAGKLTGGGGTFISDVFISNLSDDPVSVSIIFQGGAAGGSGAVGTLPGEEIKNAIQLAPRERREILDIMGTIFNKTSAFGQLIFNACRQGQDCGTATQINGISPNFRNISVETRIYSVLPASSCNSRYAQAVCDAAGTSLSTQPTNGQLFSGFPWYSFVTRDAQTVGLNSVFITGIRQGSGPGTYRSNIGLVNASQFSETDLTVRLFQGSNTTPIGTVVRHLGPLGHEQPNLTALFPGASGSNLWVTVEQTAVTPTAAATQDPANALCSDGCPGFFAYGSVLDNTTSDATTLEPQFLSPLTDKAISCLYDPTANCKVSPEIRRSVRH